MCGNTEQRAQPEQRRRRRFDLQRASAGIVEARERAAGIDGERRPEPERDDARAQPHASGEPWCGWLRPEAAEDDRWAVPPPASSELLLRRASLDARAGRRGAPLRDHHDRQQERGIELGEDTQRDEHIRPAEAPPLCGPERGERQQRGNQIEARQQCPCGADDQVDGVDDRAAACRVDEEADIAQHREGEHPQREYHEVVAESAADSVR